MTALALDVLRYVLIYGAGVVIAVLLFAFGWLTRDREKCPNCAAARREVARTVAQCQTALDTALDELAMAQAPTHFAEWEAELEGSE